MTEHDIRKQPKWVQKIIEDKNRQIRFLQQFAKKAHAMNRLMADKDKPWMVALDGKYLEQDSMPKKIFVSHDSDMRKIATVGKGDLLVLIGEGLLIWDIMIEKEIEMEEDE